MTAALLLLLGVPTLHAVRRGRLLRGIPTPEQAVERMFARACYLAGRMGAAPPRPSETPLEWAIRADAIAGPTREPTFSKLAATYSRLRFGQEKASGADTRKLYVMLEKLINRHGGEGFRRLWFRHYYGRL